MVKKIILYFLLFNFLNTVCFPEFEMEHPRGTAGLQVDQSLPDEIDSMVEFVAEYWLDLGDDFSEDMEDSDSGPLKSRTLLKDYLLPSSFAFQPALAFSVAYSIFRPVSFEITWPEVNSPPPKAILV